MLAELACDLDTWLGTQWFRDRIGVQQIGHGSESYIAPGCRIPRAFKQLVRVQRERIEIKGFSEVPVGIHDAASTCAKLLECSASNQHGNGFAAPRQLHRSAILGFPNQDREIASGICD